MNFLTMDYNLVIIVGMGLLVMAFFDIWKRKMPSVLPTALILLIAIVRFENLEFGVLAFIFAWLLYDFGYFEGKADFKSIIIIGLMMTTLLQFLVFMGLVASFGLTYQYLIASLFKIKHREEIPFVPLFLVVYVILELLIFIF